MTRQKRFVQQSNIGPASGKVLTSAALTEVKGSVAYDMATSLGQPKVPAETIWG